MSVEPTTSGPVICEHVRCSGCGADEFTVIARGPDYDHRCSGDQVFTMVRCNRCGLDYLNPRPTVEMLPVIYPSENYVCYDFSEKSGSFVARARARRNLSKVRPALKYLTQPADKLRALDIGAGDGTLLRILCSGGILPENLTGCDIDARAVENLRKQGFNGVVTRAEDLAVPAASFDLITISHVIEHVAEPRLVMERALAALAPGGIFWIETPNIAGWDWHLFKGGTWGGYHFPRHWTIFSKKTLRRMLEEVGFEVLEVSTLAATFVWVWTINHILQNLGAKRLARQFALDKFLPLAFFMVFDLLPSWLGLASNMRVIARKK